MAIDLLGLTATQHLSDIIASSTKTQVVPQDWDEEGKYQPVRVCICKSWLNLIPVFDGKQTDNGLEL